jgi:UDP-N-acetylmuramate dehydrogenase
MSLQKVKGTYKTNYNLKHLTWFKVGGSAKLFFKPFDRDDLIEFLVPNQNRLPITVIGAGSNLIIRDGGIDGAVIKLGGNFSNIEFDGHNLTVGGGCLNFNLAKFCQANAITGFEFLIGIPGTIGGGVIMNAGAYGTEFKDILLNIEAITHKGEVIMLNHQNINFTYRRSNLPKDLIITKAVFRAPLGNKDKITATMAEINTKRTATQPIKERTSGSTFINPAPHKAWELIDQSGLRGYRIGDAGISTLHCNFMINHGNASAQDLEALGEFVRETVLTKTGILLEWEIKRIGKVYCTIPTN